MAKKTPKCPEEDSSFSKSWFLKIRLIRLKHSCTQILECFLDEQYGMKKSQGYNTGSLTSLQTNKTKSALST